MKNSNRKIIQELSKAFPRSVIVKKSKVVRTGKQLLDGGYKTKQGEVIILTERYNIIEEKAEPLNHVNKMKPFFKKYGKIKFLDEYTKWFIEHHKLMIKKFPKLLKP